MYTLLSSGLVSCYLLRSLVETRRDIHERTTQYGDPAVSFLTMMRISNS